MINHRHKFTIQSDAIFTPDGTVKAEGRVFLKCEVEGCSFRFYDHEIIEFIEGLMEENSQLRERVEVYRNELSEVIDVNISILSQYAEYFRYLRDVLSQIQRITEDPYWRTMMTAKQMTDFLELLRKIVVKALGKDNHGKE